MTRYWIGNVLVQLCRSSCGSSRDCFASCGSFASCDTIGCKLDEVIATLAEETSAYAKLEIFLSHWTLKEAYVNVIGKELSQHLKVFSFDPASKAIAPDNTLGDNSRCWWFEQMHLKPAHILAVGLKHPTPELVQIDIGEATLNFCCLYLPKLQAKFDASIVSCPDQHPTAEGSQVKLPQTLYHCANRFAACVSVLKQQPWH